MITFKATGKATVATVTSRSLDEDGTVLGQTPLTVDLERVRGKIIKVTQSGKIPVFWTIADAAGDATEANLKFVDMPGGAGSGAGDAESLAKTNRVLRILMKAYQALSGRDFKVARDLADQAATMAPSLAAPQLIKGLAFYQEGNTDEAKAALVKAHALDPEDQDIEQILKVVR